MAKADSEATIAHIWRLLDEDHVPWKKFMKAVSRLESTKEPILHAVLDRNPPPIYLNQLLDIRAQDLLEGQPTIMFDGHKWCYPVGIAIMLSSSAVFATVIKATKSIMEVNHVQEMELKATLLSGVPITRIAPERLKVFMEIFPTSDTTRYQLFEAMVGLRRCDTKSWPVAQCILKYHPFLVHSIDSVNDVSRLDVRFFRLLHHCIQEGKSSQVLSKVPKFLRYLSAMDAFIDSTILHHALASIVRIANDSSSGNSILQSRTVSEILQVILDVCPESAASLDEGHKRLPLHVAAQSHIEGSIRLSETYPDAVKIKCPITNLYPFQLAAMNNREGSVDLCWQLLLVAPELLFLESRNLHQQVEYLESPLILELARHEMKMARTERQFAEHISALQQDHDQNMIAMKKRRLHLVEDASRKRKRRII